MVFSNTNRNKSFQLPTTRPNILTIFIEEYNGRIPPAISTPRYAGVHIIPVPNKAASIFFLQAICMKKKIL